MKTQNGSQRLEIINHKPEEQPVAVNYQWSGSDGTIFRGHTVASGRDQSHAERRFFRQHRHVLREAGSTLTETLVLGVLALVTVILAFALAFSRIEVRDLKATLQSSYEGQERLIQNMQSQEMMAPSNISITGGGQ